ncbi:MAG: CDP-glycerol glycerophosphotransferase family protein [Huintestinicola sp.]|uniref:CDP-glycerol glycerophosphotransferase family protein n=1 Tax=Huintestinicola sp. TaxID=2981661 RepID=UPI003F0684BD
MIKKIVKASFNSSLLKAVRSRTKRDIVLFADHFIEAQSVPQDNFYMFLYMMDSAEKELQPYYVMNKDCSLYPEMKKKYGSHIIGYTDSREFRFRILKYLKRTKIVCDSYQVFNHVIPGFAMAAKSSPEMFTIFTQHGVNFFKETFVKLRSFSSFMFDKVVVANDYEKRIFLERGLFRPENIVENGLCRWDYIHPLYSQKTIFLFFTHRRYLEKLDDVKKSVYYKTLVSFVEALMSDPAVKNNGYKVKMALHHSVLDKFGYDLLQNIDIVKDEDIEAVKSEASILITDYSSMCFEMWYQKKPVIFLRIDDMEDCIIYNNLTDLIFPYKKVGPYLCNIADSNDECIKLIKNYIATDFKLTEKEQEVRNSFFYFENDFRERFGRYLYSLKDAVKDWYVLPLNQEVYFNRFSDIFVDGIDFPNSVGRWTVSRRSSMTFRLPENSGSLKVRIRCRANIAGEQKKLSFSFYANGQKVHSRTFDSAMETDIIFSLPDNIPVNGGELTLMLKNLNGHRQSSIHPNNQDDNIVGLNLISIEICDKKAFSAVSAEKDENVYGTNNIYSRIFDITSSNMTAAGKAFSSFDKKVFMYAAVNRGDTVDISELCRCNDNREFMQLACEALLGRLPDETMESSLAAEMKLPCEQFQAMLIKKLMSSEEFRKRGIFVKNNIHASRNVGAGSPPPSGNDPLRELIKKIYKLQPVSLQNFERRIVNSLGIKI